MTVSNSDAVVTRPDSQIEDYAGTNRQSQLTLAHSNGPTPVPEDDKSHRFNTPIPTEEINPTRNNWERLFDAISWVPPRCRWDADNPSKFGLPLNILFAFSGAFTVCY
jgi:hypothetical protein